MPRDWHVDGVTVPHPSSLVAVDQTKGQINSSVVIVGSKAVRFLKLVHEKTAGQAFVDASNPGEASFNYLPLQLGAIRGWTTMFHLYGFGADERLTSMVGDVVAHAKALIVATEVDEAIFRHTAALVARRKDLPAVVLAPDDLRLEWKRVTGTSPVFEEAWSLEAVFPALKAAAKEVLGQLRSALG
jgi:hypothetical protein